MRRQWLCAMAPAVVLAVMATAVLGQGATPVPAPAAARPKNVIFMISDGMGPAAVTLTRVVSGKEALVLDEHLIGTRRTSSLDKIVTDSAAAATAMSTGHLTKNDYVCVTPEGQPLGTVLEAAKFQKKMATGLVVKSRITHATPASFSAHVMDRGDESRIAVQQLGLRVDVMFGGGTDYFLPEAAGGKRKDERDMLAEARTAGYEVITKVEAFQGALRLPVLGVFNASAMHFEIDRKPAEEPSLEEMTRQALALLGAREEGFFLMVEGSEIDHTCQANDGWAMTAEVLGYDAAFAAALEYAKRDGRTLVVSTSDHDTGGLTIVSGDWTAAREAPVRMGPNRVSIAAMVTMVSEGRDLASVLKEYTGIANVSAAEATAYDAATPGKETELQKRRVAALQKIINTREGIKWSGTSHSGVDVNVYAYGPGQELFRGARPATWTATAVAQLLGLDLEEATREARERIKGDVGKPG
jgi:alkaline phosphatase